MSQLISIVIPAYNEERFIGALLKKIQAVPTEGAGFSKELIVVDDGSSDRTAEFVTGHSGVQLIRQKNQGKGAAVQTGVNAATGDCILVQDADLEYDPMDYLSLLATLRDNPNGVVCGSRTVGIGYRKH